MCYRAVEKRAPNTFKITIRRIVIFSLRLMVVKNEENARRIDEEEKRREEKREKTEKR